MKGLFDRLCDRIGNQSTSSWTKQPCLKAELKPDSVCKFAQTQAPTCRNPFGQSVGKRTQLPCVFHWGRWWNWLERVQLETSWRRQWSHCQSYPAYLLLLFQQITNKDKNECIFFYPNWNQIGYLITRNGNCGSKSKDPNRTYEAELSFIIHKYARDSERRKSVNSQ